MPQIEKRADVEIVSRVGSGPSGTVYHARVDRRTVALKVFHSGTRVDTSVLSRFLPGAAGSLRHPNLVPILDVGSSAASDLGMEALSELHGGIRVFCTMPLLTGDPLDLLLTDLERGHAERPSLTALATGPRGELHSLFPRRAARLFAEIAEGLSLVHDAGIVHQRLHSRNLIFSPAGHLVITDFGIPTSPRPEPAAGSAASADTHALGSMLQQLLVRGGELQQESLIPKALEACVFKATAPEAPERYEHARDFAADLRRFLNHRKPLALVERERRSTRSEQRREQLGREQRQRKLELEEVTRLLAEERSRGKQLGRELQEERHRELRRTRENAAAGAQTAARMKRRRWLVRAAALTLVLTATAFFVWATVEKGRRQETAQQAAEITRLLESGNVEQALEKTRRAVAEAPDDRVVHALTDLVKSSAAKEALVGAVRAVARGRLDSAAAAIRKASAYTGESQELETLSRHLEQAADVDPVAAGLESPVARERLLALDRLELDILDGERPREDALVALRALTLAAPSEGTVDSRRLFRRALRVAALGGRSQPILTRLVIAAEEPPVTMREDQFAALHEALENIADGPALVLLCAWNVEAHAALDGARAPARVNMEPNIRVDIDGKGERHYVKRWIDWVARHDATELRLAAPELIDKPTLLPGLIDRLAATGSEWARGFLEEVAKTRPFTAGAQALEALERLGAFQPLVDIAVGEHPVGLRRVALEQLTKNLYPLCLPELRAIALTCPHPELRRVAFRGLTKSASPTAVSTIPSAVNDAVLREPALEWLVRLPPERCATEAFSLLEHPKSDVRRVAVSVLAAAEGSRLLVPLTVRLFARGHGVRAAAISLLKRKASLLGKEGHPEPLVAVVHRALKFLGDVRAPFARGIAASRQEETPSLGSRLITVRQAVEQALEQMRDEKKRSLWIRAFAERFTSADD